MSNLFLRNPLEDAQLNGSIIIDSDFSGSNLRGTDFIGAHLNQTEFTGAHLIHADFSASRLENILFQALDLEGVNFNYSEIRGEFSLAYSYLKDTEFAGATPPSPLFNKTNLLRIQDVGRLFVLHQDNVHQPFSKEQKSFFKDLQNISSSIFIPSGESTHQYKRKFEGRMKDAWKKCQSASTKPKPALYEDLYSLNALRSALPLEDDLLLQGMICKYFFGTEALREIPECQAIYNRIQAVNPQRLMKIKKRIQFMKTFREQCDFEAQVYVGLFESER